jgi:Kef-type K+ transport system membrane component KefB
LIDFIAQNVFYEIAALLTLAAVVGFLGVLLRQPLIVSFIAVGIIAGPSVLHITQSPEQIHLLAELGIAILLFLVGIKLDVKLVRTLGTVALTTGLGQVAFTAGIGFFICLALGLDTVTSLYVAVALTFSSTIIIVKLLSDKREIDSLHGRIALGFLIVQDIVVVLAMIVLSAIGIAGPGSDEGGWATSCRSSAAAPCCSPSSSSSSAMSPTR